MVTIKRGAPKAGSDEGSPEPIKEPRTPRGERTRRKILDAALEEFGERGFSDASIVGITGRARVALGTFYTYFDSKEVVFQALVQDMSDQVRQAVAPVLAGEGDAIDRERRALAAFLRLIGKRKQVYRIIDEAEFVYPEGYRRHYENAAGRIQARLRAGIDAGELRSESSAKAEEVLAWAIMGANVFVGLRFGAWESGEPEEIAGIVARLLREGLQKR